MTATNGGYAAFSTLWQSFLSFYRFAPAKLSLILVLMLLQGMTAGIGLLFILPLLQLIGFDMASPTHAGFTNAVNQFFVWLGIPLHLASLLISYVIIVGVIATIRYQLSVLSAEVQQHYICHLRSHLYRQLLQSNWEFIIRHKMSDFTHRLSGQVQGIGMAANIMLQLLSHFFLTAVMVALAFLLSWKLSCLAIGFALCLLILLLPLNRRIYGSGQAQLVNFKMIFQLLTEQLGSLKMIKSYGSEDRHADQVEQVGAALQQQTIRFTRMNALTQWILMMGSVVTFAVFFYIAQAELGIALPTILLLLIILSRLLPQVTQIQKAYQQLLHRLADIKDINDMFSICAQAQEIPLDNSNKAPPLNCHIRLESISYHYPHQDHLIIDNLSVTIAHNQTVALVGPSGAGKSTLADIIAGLLTPVSGKLLCDDTELNHEQRIAWRRSLAYVTQEVFLFHDTVRANLAWVADSPSDSALWDVLSRAAADEFVARLPQGLDTIIGDRGIRLSGGERQRIALARALLSQPQLLILDEATSNLDSHNEQKIQQALQQLQGKLTIIIIAHRETTIQHADKLIRLGNGSTSIHDSRYTEKILATG